MTPVLYHRFSLTCRNVGTRQPFRTRFRYFDLPRELRDKILDFAVVEYDTTILCMRNRQHLCRHECPRAYHRSWYNRKWHAWRFPGRRKCASGTYFTLLLVSRQVNQEAQRIFWRYNRLM